MSRKSEVPHFFPSFTDTSVFYFLFFLKEMEVFHLGKAIYLDLLGAMCSKNQANKNINDYARGKNPEVERFRLDLDVAHPVVPLTSNTTEKHITENHKKANNTFGQCQ